MFRPSRQTPVAVLILTLAWACPALAQPDDLPPPAEWAPFRTSTSGTDIGLPPGTTTAYALGRSLLHQGETEAALLYLDRAYQMAPDSWLITEAFARGLAEGGYFHDAARLYGKLVAASPDSLAQRRQHALLLAHLGQSQEALDEVLELRDLGVQDAALIRLEADLLSKLGQVDAAIESYRQAALRDADNAEGYYLAAASLLESVRRFDDMADLLREGMERVPDSRPFVHSLLRYLVHHGRSDAARRTAADADERLRSAAPTVAPEFTLELADILIQHGRLVEAQRVLAALMTAGPRYMEVESLLARIHLTLEEAADAVRVLEKACKHWPDQAELWDLQGRALEMQGDLPAAAERCAVAVDLKPDHAPYRIALLRFYLMGGRLSEAREDGDADPPLLDETILDHATRAAAVLDAQDSYGHLILGHAFRKANDMARACHHYGLARAVKDTRLIAGLELSTCLQETGRQDEALAILRDLHAEFPDDPTVANNLGYFLAERGKDLALAEQLVRQALKSEPDNGAFLDSLGWVLYQKGDYEGAFHWFVEAVNQRADDPVILEHLGLTLYRLGKRREAIDILQRAMTCGGDVGRLQGLIDEVVHEH